MTDANGWPGTAGVPLNPEQDGAHWFEAPDGNVVKHWKAADSECFGHWVFSGGLTFLRYLGPCLTPAQVAEQVAAAVAAEREACAEAARRQHDKGFPDDTLLERSIRGHFNAGWRAVYLAIQARSNP